MKKKSTTAWILEWAGQKKSSYVFSVILAIGNVVCDFNCGIIYNC